MTAPDVAERLDHVRDATRRMLAGLGALTDADVARPSLCEGWTVGHVLTHVARSADGLRRTVEGARRGELVQMYDSLEARAADIEAGATRPTAAVIADVEESARLLDETFSGLDDEMWERKMLHRRLGPRPVRDTPGMRWNEVEVHRVDLAGDYHPRDWSAAFVAYVLDGNISSIADRLPAGVAVELRTTDTAARWSFGASDGRRVDVSGPSWAVAAWLLGRSTPVLGSLSTVDGELPTLAPWG